MGSAATADLSGIFAPNGGPDKMSKNVLGGCHFVVNEGRDLERREVRIGRNSRHYCALSEEENIMRLSCTQGR
jgi:hypothetical protein